MSRPKTVLFVAQRPSDYVEMRRCALALHARGYLIHFCYHCIYGDVTAELPTLREIAQFVENQTFSRADVVAESHAIKKIDPHDLDNLVSWLNRKKFVKPKPVTPRRGDLPRWKQMILGVDDRLRKFRRRVVVTRGWI